jgi:phosphoserine aminotransferase
MNTLARPDVRPARPFFSTGPCAKHPGWTPGALASALVGRSHRSRPCRARLLEVIERTRAVLGVPAEWRIGIVPASDTGAFEMALWTLLGARGVDLLAWESFGKQWSGDVVGQLRLADVRRLEAPYGELPDLARVDCDRDVVFTWNGTTSGVRVPNGDWIADDRKGLTLCDATSAAFAMALPWAKLDAVTFSWQKVLGGEGQHGILILSPRAVERLESHTPPWPLPKIFQLAKGGKLIEGVFRGETINTPSLLAVEDVLDALKWAEAIGGGPALCRRSEANFRVVESWVRQSAWAGFLAARPETRSITSVCLAFQDSWFAGQDAEARARVAKAVPALLEDEGVAFDIDAHRDAPPGLRIWTGATVEADDLKALMPWLDWAYAQVRARFDAAA